MSVSLVQLPQTLQTKLINSTDTNPIALCPAVAGQVVRYWGGTYVGGTSILFSSDATPLTGVMSTTGLKDTLPSGNRADSAYPYLESALGETIKITPGASGLNGIAYFTQN